MMMIYPMVPFPVTLSVTQGHGVIIDALDVLCAQLTRDLFAIAKFLLVVIWAFYRRKQSQKVASLLRHHI